MLLPAFVLDFLVLDVASLDSPSLAAFPELRVARIVVVVVLSTSPPSTRLRCVILRVTSRRRMDGQISDVPWVASS